MSLFRVWVSDYLENALFGKRQLVDEFPVSKANCDVNTLSPLRKKRVDDLLCFCKLNIVSNILKSKKFIRVTLELAKSVS